MMTKYAVQTLSSSIAMALKLLQTDLKHDEFQNCELTMKFIQIIGKLFDILNSCYVDARGLKHPIRLQNLEKTEETFLSTGIKIQR